jgi:hypothetical protein
VAEMISVQLRHQPNHQLRLRAINYHTQMAKFARLQPLFRDRNGKLRTHNGIDICAMECVVMTNWTQKVE